MLLYSALLVGLTTLGVRGDSCPGPTPSTTPIPPMISPTRVIDFSYNRKDRSQVLAIPEGLDAYDVFDTGKLYRSTDYGVSNWQDLTDILYDTLPANVQASVTKRGMFVEQVYSYPDSGRWLIMGLGPYYWITDDYGLNFTGYAMPGMTQGRFSEVSVHPYNQDWVLMMVARKECESALQIDSRWCAFDLFYSADGAKSNNWLNLTQQWDNVYSFWDFDWGANIDAYWGTDKTPALASDRSIVATVYQSLADMRGVRHGWDRNLHFVTGMPDRKAAFHHVDCGNQFEFADGKIFLAVTTDCGTDPVTNKPTKALPSAYPRVKLYVSDDRGLTFTQACVPTDFEDRSYLIRQRYGPHGKYTGVFLAVDHDETDPVEAILPVANTYLSSNSKGEIFSLSIDRVLRLSWGTDLEHLSSNLGTYIANVLDDRLGTDIPFTNVIQALDYQQTRISFDDGSSWAPIPAPQQYRFPRCRGCDPSSPTCKLHLHLETSWTDAVDGRPAVYSHWNAPGLVMASGNTGETLTRQVAFTCTWLSTDGGNTWVDVADTPNIFEFADSGATILMGKHYSAGPATELQISIDGGNCFSSVPLAEALDLENIRTDPMLSSDVLLAHGTRCDRNATGVAACGSDQPWDNSGLTIAVRTRDVLKDIPACAATDRQTWTPGKDGCKFGLQFSVEVPKVGSACLNGPDFTQTRTWTWGAPCACSLRDLECEYGSSRNAADLTCSPMASPAACPLIDQRAYLPSASHLRIKDGDVCTGANVFIKDTDGRGNPLGDDSEKDDEESSVGLWVTLVVLLAIGGGGYYAWSQLDAYSKDTIKRALRDGWDVAVAKVQGGVESARTMLLGGPGVRSDGMGGVGGRGEEGHFIPLSDGLDPSDIRGPREV